MQSNPSHSASTLNAPITTQYYSNGKLLLTGEYYVLSGALALALPTQKGQSLHVTTQVQSDSATTQLHWKSYDDKQQIWLEVTFNLPDLSIVEGQPTEKALTLQSILQQAQQLNPQFLTEQAAIRVSTHLDFPTNWGLGSSSTLINNIAQWAKINPFTLLANTFGGSGYDIACAQSNTAITYQLCHQQPKSIAVLFQPPFADQLYFIHLGKKQNSRHAIQHFRKIEQEQAQKMQTTIQWINQITKSLLNCVSIEKFNQLLAEHEQIISNQLQLSTAKQLHFPDYWGQIKSLGAWGGDFVLATSMRSTQETKNYFIQKGFSTIIPFKEMIKDVM